MNPERSNAVNHSYTSTGSAVKIITADPMREFICFYAVDGACEIVIGDNTFADNAITIEEGVMWEPKVILTGNVWFSGTSGNKLTVLW